LTSSNLELNEFNALVDGFQSVLGARSEMVETEKLRCIGTKLEDLDHIDADNDQIQQKKAELTRLEVYLASLTKTRLEQQAFIDTLRLN
jgi:hypothetical protein